MNGPVYVSGGGGSSEISFTLNPINSNLVLKNKFGDVIEPSRGNTYKLKSGIYTYSVTCDGYFDNPEETIFVYEDRQINIRLYKKLYVNFNVYPLDAEIKLLDGDGNIVNSSTKNQYILKEGLYSYSVTRNSYVPVKNVAFSITEDEVIKNIDVTLVPSLFGVKRQITSTSTSWERIGHSVDLVANATHDGEPVQNDFDNIYPWSDIITCDVNADGTINKYYGDADFDFKNPVGYIMTKFPEFWWKREQVDGYEYVYISKEEQEGFKKSNSFMLGRYNAGGSSSAISSKSGISPLTNININQFRQYCRNIGPNWGMLDISRWSMLQLLYLVEYADYDSQKTLGNGICGGSVSSSGQCDNLGMKSGCFFDDNKHSVIYRGVENIFGNIYQFCDGLNITNQQSWVCRDITQYVSDKFASPYQKLSYINVKDHGFISKLGYDVNNPEIQMPIAVSGSGSTYIPDYNHYGNGNCILVVGGYYSENDICGVWRSYCSCSAASSSSYLGGRLLLIPV